MNKPEAFDLWTWSKCHEKICTLEGRLGFPKGKLLRFLGFELNLANGKVTDTITKTVSDDPPEYILYLLYRYAEAKEVSLTGELINYRQIPGGRIYNPVFEGRVVMPIAHGLSKSPEIFQQAAEAFGGHKLAQGDLAYSIPALPRIPLTYILWLADEEFPARAQVLMDRSVTNYLDAEPLSHLAALTSKRLLDFRKKM
ncbi:MAG: DUF3786 domain-containing protein [Promethearchaeota archaeon]